MILVDFMLKSEKKHYNKFIFTKKRFNFVGNSHFEIE